MVKRMLIDATHAEESRVVVLDGNTLEDFDIETASRKQLKGNIYLAKVIRVEPSLQAAFVEYGGGRHGFLAFGEIHPDYYQIPVADRQRLLALQAEEARAAAALDAALDDTMDTVLAQAESTAREPAADTAANALLPSGTADAADPAAPAGPRPPQEDAAEPDYMAQAPTAAAPKSDEGEERGAEQPSTPAQPATRHPEERFGGPEEAASVPETTPEPDVPGGDEAAAEPVVVSGEEPPEPADEAPLETDTDSGAELGADAEADTDGADRQVLPTTIPEPPPEMLGGDEVETDREAADARARRASRFLRTYRIQEVIHRRQVMLVQVVKEERGTKGAALTTYISLAGRYSVLMPNSPRGGGISRKITSATDRKRLREVTQELDLPSGMGLIVRTAGANRPKPEIRRDCEYLMRLWDDIRELTLRSVAPALIYEEASLIKRAIRDVYARDVDEIIVDGEEGWRAAHEFMRQLMPTHASKVRLWRGDGGGRPSQPLFARYQVEAQLESMLSPTVQLKSGGYLVIDQTEALVAVDVNSGRSTRERNVEETAVRTNLEAADEVGRQLRLRDLAGLIVIDFIDMESRKHVAAVERRLKDALRDDRARIQVGHISHFGLLEMSRQRLRPSLAETSLDVCPHCGGTGHVRSAESSAITVLRSIEDEGAKGRASVVAAHASAAVVTYLLNHKRERLAEIEQRFGMRVQFAIDDALPAGQTRLERLRAQSEDGRPIPTPVVPVPPAAQTADDLEDKEPQAVGALAGDTSPEEIGTGLPAGPSGPPDGAGTAELASPSETSDEAEHRRRRRRRRRGGRRERGTEGGAPEAERDEPDTVADLELGRPEPEGLFAEPLDDVAEPLQAAAPTEAPLPATDLAVPEPAPSPDSTGHPIAADAAGVEEVVHRRPRRGGRRRRSEGVAVPDEQPDLPPYAGPTPANPYGGYDVFDLLETEAPAAAEPASREPDLFEASNGSPGQQAGAPVPEPPVHAAEQEPEPEQLAGALEPTSLGQPTEEQIARPEPSVGAAIQPVLLGEGGERPRRRGWWRG
jgi:ribonuclease E